MAAPTVTVAPTAAAAGGDHGCHTAGYARSLTAGGTTTCGFARNVERYLNSHSLEHPIFRVTSPTTGRRYRLRCSHPSGKVYSCRNAFPLNSPIRAVVRFAHSGG